MIGLPANRRPAPRRRSGFTLVELLLAIALSIALLAALWTMFDIFTGLFDKGQARVEHAQLARALVEQITRDLRAAIQDPVAGAPAEPPGPVPVRRFGLFGTSQALRFDVLEVTPEEANPTPVGRGPAATAAVPEARVPELRTVYYEFRSPSVRQPEQAAPPAGPSGLVRRELDFETPIEEQDTLAAGRAPAVDLLADDAEPPVEPSEAQAAEPADTSVVWVPEVADVQFRYFDGNGWSSSWDSLQRKSLPVAVEVTLRMADASGETAAAPRAPQPGGTRELANRSSGFAESDESFAPEELLERGPVEPTGSTIRIVVDLPGSPTYRKPRPKAIAKAPAIRRPARRVSPRLVAPRPAVRRPAPPPVRIAPEQWIRRQAP